MYSRHQELKQASKQASKQAPQPIHELLVATEAVGEIFTPIAMGMVNEMISSMQGGAPPLSTRCYTSFWAWARAFPYAPSPQSCAEETGGVRLPLFFWLDWQHFRGASCVRCPPQLVPSTGGGVFLRFPHAWDDPRLGACAHERAVTYLRMPRLLCPLASRTQPSGAPPVRTPQGPTTEGGHASC